MHTFSYKAATIEKLVPFFKIGSGEFQDKWFIDNLIASKKPVLFPQVCAHGMSYCRMLCTSKKQALILH